MNEKKLNLRPLQELLTNEVELDSLINHVNRIYYYFTESCMRMSNSEKVPIEKEIVICLYWIARLKQVFEEMKN